MTDKLETLTGKIDALRAKGFSDEEINALLNHSQTEVPESPFNIGEIFNNGASKDEWNKKVDETEGIYVAQGLIMVSLFAVIAVILNLIEYDIVTASVGTWVVFLCVSIGLIWFATYGPKNRANYKFFIKKWR